PRATVFGIKSNLALTGRYAAYGQQVAEAAANKKHVRCFSCVIPAADTYAKYPSNVAQQGAHSPARCHRCAKFQYRAPANTPLSSPLNLGANRDYAPTQDAPDKAYASAHLPTRAPMRRSRWVS